jgi:hypothetical protein
MCLRSYLPLALHLDFVAMPQGRCRSISMKTITCARGRNLRISYASPIGAASWSQAGRGILHSPSY